MFYPVPPEALKTINYQNISDTAYIDMCRNHEFATSFA